MLKNIFTITVILIGLTVLTEAIELTDGNFKDKLVREYIGNKYVNPEDFELESGYPMDKPTEKEVEPIKKNVPIAQPEPFWYLKEMKIGDAVYALSMRGYTRLEIEKILYKLGWWKDEFKDGYFLPVSQMRYDLSPTR